MPLPAYRSAHYTAKVRVDSPLGPILMASTANGLAGLWFEGQKDHPGPLDHVTTRMDDVLRTACDQMEVYWRGGLRLFSLPLDLIGTPFQVAVWQALLDISPGRTSSYGALAKDLGRPQASRAVGAAVGRNPISVIVPCHRVIGRDAQLTGYAGGLPRKIDLLCREGLAVQGQLVVSTPPRQGTLAGLEGWVQEARS